MGQMKKTIIIATSLALLVPSFYVVANEYDTEKSYKVAVSGSKDNIPQLTNSNKTDVGKISTKDEVIYGKLSSDGKQQKIFVVNSLEVTDAGKIVDYGIYSDLKNLTDLTDVVQTGDQVEVAAPKGKFYYQGTLQGVELPWDINVAYFLDGKKLAANDLAGKSGKVEIQIKTERNNNAEDVFAKNYLLQISVPLDGGKFTNIEAEDGMVASVGKNKQVTFTVMPNNNGDFVLSADVTNFSIDGIDINGIPSIVAVDEPDVSDMKKDLTTLADAIGELNDGVSELNNGIKKLNDGTTSLADGSEQYKEGLGSINSASSQLLESSEEINEALSMMSEAVVESGLGDFGQFEELVRGLNAVSGGLYETAEGLTALKNNYSSAWTALEGAIKEIPNDNLTETQIHQLYESGADVLVVEQLVKGYSSALKVKAVYEQTSQLFSAVVPTLTDISAGLNVMAGNVNKMASGLSESLASMSEGMSGLNELLAGIRLLAENYGEFHGGLTSYTNGVNEVVKSYGEIHNGIVEISSGTSELSNGAGKLHEGTIELHKETKDLPNKMQAEIDEMMSEYSNDDYKLVSFVSNKNKQINSVQFVLKTESIKAESDEDVIQPKKEKQGFWARLWNLFKKD